MELCGTCHNLQKTVQSKLWYDPGIFAQKATSNFFGLARYYDAASSSLTVSVDNEAGQMGSPYTVPGPGAPATAFVYGPTAVGQAGVLTGLTIKTNAKDMALVTVSVFDQDVGWRGT